MSGIPRLFTPPPLPDWNLPRKTKPPNIFFGLAKKPGAAGNRGIPLIVMTQPNGS